MSGALTSRFPGIDAAADEADTARALGELRAQGYCILPGLLPREVVDALDREIAERFLDTPFSQGDFYGHRTKRFGRLLMRARSAHLLAEHPAILAIATRLLEPFCDTIQLNVMQAIEIHPGEIAQVPHRDEDMWQGEKGRTQYLLNVMWPLTPFTAESGATVIWPGSHDEGKAAPLEPGLPARCEPGGAILFLGSTLHGGGANLTAKPRRGIVAGYSLGWLKPYENPWLAYPPEVARHFSPSLTALIGYRQHRPNLGNVDGRCPSLLLEGPLPDHGPAIDALRPDQQEMVAEHAAREAARIGIPPQ